MDRSRWTGWSLIALGLGMAASTALGPLMLGLIRFRITTSMENQLLGGDAISLGLVAPVAIVGGLLWLRGHPLAPPLALAPALYAVYTYLTNILTPDYARYAGNSERAYPLFVALIVLGWLVAGRAWIVLAATPPLTLPRWLSRSLAVLLLVMSLFIGLTWWRQIGLVMGGTYSPDYLEHPTAFWLIRTLDTAFIIPAAVATAIGLLRRQAVAVKAAFALAGFFTGLGGSVAAMGLVMAARRDPAASPLLVAGFLLLALLFGAATALLLRVAARAGRPTPAGGRPADMVPLGRA